MHAYRVTINIPLGVTTKQMEEYIRNAVRGWRGGFATTDPIFNLPKTAFTVKYIEEVL